MSEGTNQDGEISLWFEASSSLELREGAKQLLSPGTAHPQHLYCDKEQLGISSTSSSVDRLLL